MKKFLIITADDYGASKNINEGIRIAAEKKAITAISALSNFVEALPELKTLSENHPDIGIGVHFNITTGKPILGAEQVPTLVNSIGNFYTIEELLPKIHRVSFDELLQELSAQILVLKKHEIKIDHFSDHHGILSLYSPFFDILARLSEKHKVPLRSPYIASKKYPKRFPNSQIKKRGRNIAIKFAMKTPLKAIKFLNYSGTREIKRKIQKLKDLKIIHPDVLIEYFWGNPTTSNYLHILNNLPSGTSEIVLHCGTNSRQEKYPSGLDLDYFENRERELETITSEHLTEIYDQLNIKTIGYSALVK